MWRLLRRRRRRLASRDVSRILGSTLLSFRLLLRRRRLFIIIRFYYPPRGYRLPLFGTRHTLSAGRLWTTCITHIPNCLILRSNVVGWSPRAARGSYMDSEYHLRGTFGLGHISKSIATISGISRGVQSFTLGFRPGKQVQRAHYGGRGILDWVAVYRGRARPLRNWILLVYGWCSLSLVLALRSVTSALLMDGISA